MLELSLDIWIHVFTYCNIWRSIHNMNRIRSVSKEYKNAVQVVVVCHKKFIANIMSQIVCHSIMEYPSFARYFYAPRRVFEVTVGDSKDACNICGILKNKFKRVVSHRHPYDHYRIIAWKPVNTVVKY